MIRNHFLMFASLLFVFSCSNQNNTENTTITSKYIKTLQKEVLANPENITLHYTLVNSLDSAGYYLEAMNQINQLISKDSLNAQFWLTKGQIQEHAKDTSGAIISYHRSIRVYASPDAMLTLANIYAETKNDTALVLCNNVLQMKLGRQYDAHANFIAGVYYARKLHYSKAFALFDECINNSYTYIVAYLEKGFIYYDLKNYNDALKIFQLAATISNAYSDAYYWQAKCFEALNNKTEAINNYQKSLALDKNLKEAAIALKRLNQ
jgi:tetratricopeptide (TPR) repeat protein